MWKFSPEFGGWRSVMPKEWINYRQFPRKFLFMFACCFLIDSIPTATAADAIINDAIHGSASVIDGDTIKVRKFHIRLLGMDAPEKAQVCRDRMGQEYLCGSAATATLEQIISGDVVACKASTKDRYGRQLATCSTRKFSDIGLEMVRRGWATVYDGATPSSDYKLAEDEARRRQLGLWLGTFDRPSAWRKNRRT
jgi:endonuclease YncB( thermonuclease family)